MDDPSETKKGFDQDVAHYRAATVMERCWLTQFAADRGGDGFREMLHAIQFRAFHHHAR